MTDWQTVLREIGSQDDEDRLSADEAESMRRAVLAVASTTAPEPDGWSWVRPVFLVAAVVAVIAVGIVGGRRFDRAELPRSRVTLPDQSEARTQSVDIATPNRQLQFLTPGGTRIIWVFNSEFDTKATMR